MEQESKKGNKPGLIYGFADITGIATVEKDGVVLNKAISVGCALDPSALSSLSDGLTKKYHNEFLASSMFIEVLSFKLTNYLQELGYEAMALEKSMLVDDSVLGIEEKEILTSSFSPLWALQRFFAAHAGLGWIGKNGLLVSKQYGPGLLLVTVFTNAPLDCATEVFLSRCGRCKECAIACPAGAIDIFGRASLDNLENAVDIDACLEECRRISLETFGQQMELCAKCIYACPYTKSYLRRKGYPYE